MDVVSVVIPTRNRPVPLRRAIASVLRQTGLSDISVEILVIDNSLEGNARDIVEGMAVTAAHPVHWLHEPQAGVASARNLGVNSARGRWIAFLDDDEEAQAAWIAALVAVARKTGADAVFGPVEAQAEAGAQIGPFAPYFSRRIERADASDITDCVAQLGTNNSMFERVACFGRGHPFDLTLNSTGGEDSLTLMRLKLEGRRFAFAAQARVTEWVPQRRLTWEYLRKRKFLSGQIRVFVLAMVQPAHWLQILAWMAIGLAQACAGGLAMLVLLPAGGSRCAAASLRCYGGLGKVFWTRGFRPQLYGQGHVS